MCDQTYITYCIHAHIHAFLTVHCITYVTRWRYIHYTLTHTLHYTTLHYVTIHCVAIHYSRLHYVTLHYTTLHYTHYIYTTAHYTTLHCILLHYMAHIRTYIHTFIHTEQTPTHAYMHTDITHINIITLHCTQHMRYTHNIKGPSNPARKVVAASLTKADGRKDVAAWRERTKSKKDRTKEE